MRKRKRPALLPILVAMALLPLPVAAYGSGGKAAGAMSLKERAAAVQAKREMRVTQEEREAAAARMELQRLAAETPGAKTRAAAVPEPQPGGVPDYFGDANWAYSPTLKKFVDGLPGLGADNPNELGQFIPIAKPDTITYPGSDYYEIELQQFTEQMHEQLPATTLRGYVQTNLGTDGTGHNTLVPDPIHFLGPLISARKGTPVRVKFTNTLDIGTDGDLFLPVDTTVMGAGMGPLGMDAMPMNYTQNRGTLHLHGGFSPWISDGTPHQWITPANEDTPYPEGVSVQNVPDMADPGDGAETFFYTNDQSARMMFYHDHSYGITRLNVYAGEAAGYLIGDETEDALVAASTIPTEQIPLVIQDKTFVDAATVRDTDPTWNWGTGTPVAGVRPPVTGDLWYPHVYSPAQNPADASGMNAFGRWHYGPWFWPPTTGITHPPIANPYYDPSTAAWEPPLMPATPNPSMPGEAFMDTPMVNGTAYPTLEVDPKSYRFRILNAADDRFWNLQLYESDPATVSADGRHDTEVKMVPASVCATNFPEGWPTDGREGGVPDPATRGPQWIQIGTEGGFLPAPAIVPQQPVTWNLDPTTFNFGNVDLHSLLVGTAERADVIVDFSAYRGKTLIMYNDAPAAFPALDARYDYYTGAPDLTSTGGHATPQVGFGPNTRTIMQIKVKDVTPADPFDLAALNEAFASTATTEGVFQSSQNPVIVPDSRYDSAYDASFTVDPYVRIYQNNITFGTLNETTLTISMKPKAIQDEMGEAFDPEYGRMMGKLGLELPNTSALKQNFVLQAYIDPPTEEVEVEMTPMAPAAGDGTQIWKITHNGVDTHTIHWHLFDVQLINRVGWDNGIRPPDDNELGWKDTIRVSPLEDTIVALRPLKPKVPFGVPESVRPYDPTMPIGSTAGFTNINPTTGQPIVPPVTNQIINFGWEYVWHCHILAHEEMDMMRPIVANVSSSLATAANPVTATRVTGGVDLTWIDATPPSLASTWGNPANEIGFRVERAGFNANGQPGSYAAVTTALANKTTYRDTTAAAGTAYSYRIVAFNAAGDSISQAVTVPATPAGKTYVSINGNDRYATSVLASKAGFPSASTVVIATGENWPDALGGAALAGAKGGPILLTRRDSLPSNVSAEITRLGASDAIILGSTAAVSSTVFNALQQKLGAGHVSRIGGANRYATADLIARATKTALGAAFTGTCFIATGTDYPDGLSASPLADAKRWPVLLCGPTGLSSSTRSTLAAIGTTKVLIVGSTQVVSQAVQTSLAAYNPTRLSGANRYATCAAVANYGVNTAGLGWNRIGIATGEDFPDALVGGVLQGNNGAVMLLTRTTTLSSEARSVLQAHKAVINTVYLYGGIAANNSMRNQIANALQ